MFTTGLCFGVMKSSLPRAVEEQEQLPPSSVVVTDLIARSPAHAYRLDLTVSPIRTGHGGKLIAILICLTVKTMATQ